MMSDFLDHQHEKQEYDAFLTRKVEKARASARAGRCLTHDEVEAEFAARRARVTGRE